MELVDGSGWDRYFDGSFTVDPNDVVTILRIPVPEKDDRLPARYNITFVIPDPPEECLPNTTLWCSNLFNFHFPLEIMSQGFPRLCITRSFVWNGTGWESVRCLVTTDFGNDKILLTMSVGWFSLKQTEWIA